MCTVCIVCIRVCKDHPTQRKSSQENPRVTPHRDWHLPLCRAWRSEREIKECKGKKGWGPMGLECFSGCKISGTYYPELPCARPKGTQETTRRSDPSRKLPVSPRTRSQGTKKEPAPTSFILLSHQRNSVPGPLCGSGQGSRHTEGGAEMV